MVGRASDWQFRSAALRSAPIAGSRQSARRSRQWPPRKRRDGSRHGRQSCIIAAATTRRRRRRFLQHTESSTRFYAHSTSDPSRGNWQGLRDHLLGVAGLSEQFGQWLGIAKASRLAGLLHDLGKYTPEFQDRLAGSAVPVDHSTAGAYHVTSLVDPEAWTETGQT